MIDLIAGITTLSWNEFVGGLSAIMIAGGPSIIALMKIRELTIHVNSRLDKLLFVAEKLAYEQGFAAGSVKERAIAENIAKELLALKAGQPNTDYFKEPKDNV